MTTIFTPEYLARITADLRPAPTHAELLEDPSKMTHRGKAIIAIKAFNGLCGALVDNGKWIVTSPNMKRIFYPPLGGDRPIYLRKSLRYGDDDPIQWPQNFIPDAPHLPCIPIRKNDTEDPMQILWWMPTEADFLEEGSVVKGLGRLMPYIITLLAKPCRSLLERAEKQKSDDFTQVLANLLKSFLDRISFLPASFRTTQRLTRELQRLALELCGRLTFLEIVLPKSKEPPTKSAPEAAKVIGAFTMNLTVCEDLFRIGIPVYLIRPSGGVATMKIR
ncbi:hypothetical protein DXG01_002499, partial [Tephrocybe rancida]